MKLVSGVALAIVMAQSTVAYADISTSNDTHQAECYVATLETGDTESADHHLGLVTGNVEEKVGAALIDTANWDYDEFMDTYRVCQREMETDLWENHK